jgi:Zn finger protein HypA/HybF involved in hydrogenase expression
MATEEQGSLVMIRCRTCTLSFVPNVNQVKREQMIVCPHCKSHYMPSSAAGKFSSTQPSAP